MTLAETKEVIPDGISVGGGHMGGGVLVVSPVELGYRLCWRRSFAVLEQNRLRLLGRLMVTGPGHRPVLLQPLPLPSLGYHYFQCVTSDSLGQALQQSILLNLENQPSLQKQRGNIGNKDGYIIWRQAFFSCSAGYLLSGRWGRGRGRREGGWERGICQRLEKVVKRPKYTCKSQCPTTDPPRLIQAASTFSINGNLIAWKAINGN